jgi:anionic cell wall polymer biosynthesis LytR-Cps2A-Psr (LCP) family protein
VRIVDELGGIDISLPHTIDGRVPGSKDANLYFPAGQIHLNGYRTMLLARLRPQGDFQRSEVQNLILQALAGKLFSPSIVRQLPSLIATFSDSVQTDLGPVEIGQLLCLSSMVDAEEIEFLSFPDNLFKSDRVRDRVLGNTSIVAADFEVLRTYVQKFVDGTWPEPGEDTPEGVEP